MNDFHIGWSALPTTTELLLPKTHFCQHCVRALQQKPSACESETHRFMHPLVYGDDYPPVMRGRVGDRLPRLSAEESALARGSFDFVGVNHYLIVRIRSSPEEEEEPKDYYVDAGVQSNEP